MPLHDGLPAVWNDAPYPCFNEVGACPEDILEYMRTWSLNMSSAMGLVVSNEDVKANGLLDGAFHPSCLIHTTFSHTQPMIDDLNYAAAAAAWLNGEGGGSKEAHLHIDSCDDVMCNPSCKKK